MARIEAFDSTFLTLLFVPNAPCSVDRGRERVDFLISDIHGRGDRILVPAPVLAEVLIGVGHSRSLILNEITKSPKFLVGAFDTRAALELALITEQLSSRSKRKKSATGSRAKVAFDRQILAIAKVFDASTLYTDDVDMREIAKAIGMNVKTAADLSLPFPARKPGPTLFSGVEDGEDKKPE